MSSSARRTFYESMMRHGFTMLRLHKVDPFGVCQCREGAACRNPGRHFSTRHGWQSVIKTVDDLEQHLDEGGSVGLSLWYEEQRIPQSPGNLVVFDCDEAAAEPWLRSQGITSPLMVTGRRGVHVYCRMPAGVPLLKTDTRTLRSPKVDIKVSGLVLAPWSPDKRLCIWGQDVTDDPAAIAEFLGDYQRLLANLPEVDPRVIVPGMTERFPPQPIAPTSAPPGGVPAARPAQPPQRRVRFSEDHPATFYAGYTGLPYNRRKTNAGNHTRVLKPSIVGKDPHARLLKAAADSILHYGMSDQDTWEIIRDRFNPRCRDRDGNRYPWRKHEVAWAIGVTHQPGSYSTLDLIRGEVDISNAVEHERSRGERANARRLAGQARDRSQDYGNVREFLETYYEADDAAVIPFSTLLRAVNRGLAVEAQEPVTRNRLGRLLAEDGIDSERGAVAGLKVRDCIDPYTCENTLRHLSCPVSPCPLNYQRGV